MPTKVVEVHRWQVIGAFLLLVASSVSVAFWNDRRIDQAERRITRNAALIAERRASERESLIRDRKICQETNKVKAQLVIALRRSLATTPTLAYYREHPDELEAALVATRQTIREFAPTRCPPAPR